MKYGYQISIGYYLGWLCRKKLLEGRIQFSNHMFSILDLAPPPEKILVELKGGKWNSPK